MKKLSYPFLSRLFSCVFSGYRHIHLLSKDGTNIPPSSLFVHIRISDLEWNLSIPLRSGSSAYYLVIKVAPVENTQQFLKYCSYLMWNTTPNVLCFLISRCILNTHVLLVCSCDWLSLVYGAKYSCLPENSLSWRTVCHRKCTFSVIAYETFHLLVNVSRC